MKKQYSLLCLLLMCLGALMINVNANNSLTDLNERVVVLEETAPVDKKTLKEKVDNAKAILASPNASAQQKNKAQGMLDRLVAKAEYMLTATDVSQAEKVKAQKILDYINK